MPSRPAHFLLRAASAAACAFAVLAPASVPALPSFSRGGAIPCARCHDGFSALNQRGMRFLQDGFRLPAGEGRVRGMLRPLAVSAVAEMHADVASARPAAGHALPQPDDDWRASHQGDVALHAAGTWREHAAFHVEAQLPTRHGVLVTNTAFVQVNDLLRGGGLSLKAGAFRVPGAYLAWSRPERFAAFLTPESLPAHGVELDEGFGAWSGGAGLIQSRRRPEGTGTLARAFGRLEDTYFWLARDLGAQRIGARMLFDRQDSNLRTLAWLQHLQAQASARLVAGRLVFAPAYAFDRFDDRPSAGLHQRRQTGLLEARMPLDRARRWNVTAFAEHDYTTRTVYTPEQDRHQEALALGCAVRSNAELALEWAQAGDNTAGPRVRQLNTMLRFGY